MFLGLSLLLALLGNVPTALADKSWPSSTVHARLRNMNFGLTTAIIDVEKEIGQQFLGQTIRQDEKMDTPRKKNNSVPGLPHATSLSGCVSKWSAYFKKKSSSQKELACCQARRSCMCYEDLCTRNHKLKGCKNLNVNCGKQKACQGLNTSDRDCLDLKDIHASFFNAFNWLWILIIIAVLMIMLICVATWCVFRKKFAGKNSEKDRNAAKYTFGQMNVDSKAKYQGKDKSHSKKVAKSSAAKKITSRGPSASRGKNFNRAASSRKNVKKSQSRQVSKSANRKGISAPQSYGKIGAHAGKKPPS